jgi:hypothetical protein
MVELSKPKTKLFLHIRADFAMCIGYLELLAHYFILKECYAKLYELKSIEVHVI